MNKYIATFHSDMDCPSETIKTVIEAEHEFDAWGEACTYARENYTTEDRVTVTLSLHVQTALIGGQLPPPTYN